MAQFRRLSDTMLASPQISVADVSDALAQGVTLIINNRPEGESDDQVPGPQIEAAARAAGIDYVAIPITHSGFSAPQVDAMAEALARASGQVLGYCRSGTRSTLLWALAQAKAGESPDAIAAAAADAGYDVSPIRGAMDALAGAAH
ncbi:MAG: TIGR01244 family sulfur transferase [Tsuneonella suprasediminis]|uniref:TIGR01244 family phosphatase n=1 Tax=Tsuneonella suprasediminis TaxID=2306996 RepID=A0A419QYC7_9SPHN|nr:TIGR01244 family sulfur transferase [Tsuneonella suprasediminis]RJX65649.1 TIGR01244 family phosphatase [Tsuneonella suprasediminis]UBS33524.1 TIGR01244 family phosphatase [Altererythrobacter sp. N1]